MTDWDKRYEEGEHVNDEPHALITNFATKLAPGRALDIATNLRRLGGSTIQTSQIPTSESFEALSGTSRLTDEFVFRKLCCVFE